MREVLRYCYRRRRYDCGVVMPIPLRVSFHQAESNFEPERIGVEIPRIDGGAATKVLG